MNHLPINENDLADMNFDLPAGTGSQPHPFQHLLALPDVPGSLAGGRLHD